MLDQPRSIRLVLKRFGAGEHLDWHAHNYACVCVLLRGQMLESTESHTTRASRGTVIYKPARVRHTNHFGAAGAVVVSAQLDRPWIALRDGRYHLPESVLIRQSSRARWLAERMASAIGTEATDPIAMLRLDGLALELVAEVATLASGGSPVAGVPAWLDDVRSRMAQDLPALRSVDAYAREADVQPRYLARMFRRYYEEPVVACMRRLRIEWAMRQLLESNASITRIALAASFADQSHFAHAFRQQTGVSPSAFRRSRTGKGP